MLKEDYRMDKIYMTSLHLQPGGVQFIVSQMANAFSDKGYQVCILCTYNLGPPAFAINSNVEIRYLTKMKPNREEFKHALKTFRLDKILVEGFKALKILQAKKRVLKESFKKITEGIIISTRNEDSVLLSKFGDSNVLKIAQIHHDVKVGSKVAKNIHGGYDRINYLVVLTDDVKKEMEESIIKEDSKMKCLTIENFIVPMQQYDISSRDKTIISVGRLHEDKGFDRLLDIFSQVHQTYPEWKLEIVGDGLLKEELKKKAQDLNIESHVSFKGFLSNQETRNKMGRASIYAMTSIHEGFGIVLIEAMDSGLPVISYDVRMGPKSIINHGINGYLVPDGDMQMYINQIKEMINDEEMRISLAKNAQIRAKDFYQEKIIGKWIELFRWNRSC